MNRRRFLGSTVRSVLVSGGTLSVAGCLSAFGGPGASKLGVVVITNRHDKRHTVDFRVRWDGETVHESTHEVAGRSGTEVGGSAAPAKTWPDEPGQFTVSARTQDDDWHTIDPADHDYPDCYAVNVGISEMGRLRMLTATNEYECSDEALRHNREAANESNSSSQLADLQRRS